MEIKHGFTNLVEYPLFVFLFKNSFPYQSEKIDVHMLKYEVDIDVIIGANDLLQLDDVGVSELHEKHDFAIGALSVGGVIKSIEIFFKGFYFFIFVVNYFPDVSVGPGTYFFEYFELAENV